MQIDINNAVELLASYEDIYILTHQSPDGDTLGAGFALYYALRQMEKRVRVVCSDEFVEKYSYMYEDYQDDDFQPQAIVAVDIADTMLMGKYQEIYGGKVDLCIDHHVSNTGYAKNTLLFPKAAAACEVLYNLFEKMGTEYNDTIARCIYTGIATDTGCFKYSNTTPQSHIIASRMMSYDLDFEHINRLLFDVKSKGRIALERVGLSNMEYYFDDKCAILHVSGEMIGEAGLKDSDLEGITNLTTQLEGVEVGITVKEREKGIFKISFRSADRLDVSKICQKLGGGGHIKAAGCLLKGNYEDVRQTLLDAVKSGLENL